MSWSYIDNLLFSLDKMVFVAYFLVLVSAMAVERKVSSFIIALIVLTVANGAMTSLSPMLYQYASQPDLNAKFTWYASFALIDMLAVFLLFKFHKLLGQNVGFIAKLVGILFVTFATLQTGRFVDRFVFNTEFLQYIYQYAIPVLNIILVPVIIFALISEFRLQRQHPRATI